MTNKIYKPVLPCGKLYVQGEVYFLLSLYPIKRDSWQQYNQQRFVVVPTKENLDTVHGNLEYVYPHARHIVCTDPLIEYSVFQKPIYVLQVLEEDGEQSIPYELEDEEWHEEEPEYLEADRVSFLQSVGAEPVDLKDDELEQNKHAVDYLNELNRWDVYG